MNESDRQVSRNSLAAALEAILMVVDSPVPVVELATAVGFPETEVTTCLLELQQQYETGFDSDSAAVALNYAQSGDVRSAADQSGDVQSADIATDDSLADNRQDTSIKASAITAVRSRGFVLREVAGGWRIYSAPEFAPIVERFIVGGRTAHLTQASLETLAVIAYRQPISRSKIAAVRGVNVDGVVRTLMSRGLIEEVGQEDSGAILYGTTDMFLEKIGLNGLEELPPLAPYLPQLEELADVVATMEVSNE